MSLVSKQKVTESWTNDTLKLLSQAFSLSNSPSPNPLLPTFYITKKGFGV